MKKCLKHLIDRYNTFIGLQKISAHAFKHIRGLKKLDLADNGISNIDYNAFDEVTSNKSNLIRSIFINNSGSHWVLNLVKTGSEKYTKKGLKDILSKKCALDTTVQQFQRKIKWLGLLLPE